MGSEMCIRDRLSVLETRVLLRSHPPCPQKLLLLPRQLLRCRFTHPRSLSPNQSFLSHPPRWPPRLLDLPLPLPSLGSTSRHSRPNILRLRNPSPPLRLHRLRRFPHQRRICPRFGSDARCRRRLPPRRVPRAGGSVPRRSGEFSGYRIPLLPPRPCLRRCRRRRRCSHRCLTRLGKKKISVKSSDLVMFLPDLMSFDAWRKNES